MKMKVTERFVFDENTQQDTISIITLRISLSPVLLSYIFTESEFTGLW